jgi:hypothetical protein
MLCSSLNLSYPLLVLLLSSTLLVGWMAGLWVQPYINISPVSVIVASALTIALVLFAVAALGLCSSQGTALLLLTGGNTNAH